VPNLAAREHTKNIEHVFKLALKKAKIKNFNKEIDIMAVTCGPGLGPSLLVGIAFARTLAWKYNKPLVGVNHLEGHIYSNWLLPIAVSTKSQTPNHKQIQNKKIFPILNLIVSGGHTELVLMENHGKYKIIGETLDDAVGEAFDKVARLLGLGYPGGPQIARHAEQFTQTNADSTQINADNISVNPRINQRKSALVEFPRPMINSKNYNFSYSGLKTSVLYKVRDLKAAGVKITGDVINEICWEFQNAALDVPIYKTAKAAEEFGVRSIFLSGGVSANKELRRRLSAEAKKLKVKYSQPEFEYTTDNAAMIAMAGYFKVKSKNEKVKTDWESVEMDANLDLGIRI
jgi:N6-L-threonylcarbamoyladenine synthase